MCAFFQAGKAPIVVLDTNATLDWLVFRNGHMAPVAAAVQSGSVRWIASAAMRQELAHMLHHSSLARWHPDPAQALGMFDSVACLVEPPQASPLPDLRCADPDDQIFIDLALAQQAHWLLSHDRAVLKLARRARLQRLLIVRPADWQPDATLRHTAGGRRLPNTAG